MKINELITPRIVNTNIKKPHDIAGNIALRAQSASISGKGKPIVGKGDPDAPSISGAEYSKTNFFPSKLDDDGYNAYVKAVTPLMGSNPYVPEIYKIVHVKDPSGGVVPRYEMHEYETYDKFSSKAILAMIRKAFPDDAKKIDINLANDPTLKMDNEMMWKVLIVKIREALTDNTPTNDKKLNQVLQIIRDVTSSNPAFVYDMHLNNCMIRRTSFGPQLVVTDPIQDSGHSTVQSTGIAPFRAKRGHKELYTAVADIDDQIDKMIDQGNVEPTQEKCDAIVNKISAGSTFPTKELLVAFHKRYKKTPLEVASEYYSYHK